MAGEKSTTFSGQILALYFNGTAPNWQTKKREVKKASYVYT